MESSILAFEGAEGYGADTVGGRGGTVVHVTNLNDYGAGSLRWALEKLEGPRIIVFDVAGTIQLKEQILIEHGNVTIAGQTAPGEGITLAGAGIRVKADEVIMRGLHIRPGDGEGKVADDRDALMIGTTDFTVNNVIVDHNSFTWAIDENVAINGKVQDLSFTNNIVAEGLSRSLHSKGEHSKGLLLSNWGGEEGDDSRVTIAKNLLTDNMQRNAEIRAGQDVEYINNYVYNYGMAHVGMYIGGGNGGTLTLDVDVIGNVWQPGVNTGGKKQPIALADMAEDSTVMISDNIYEGYAKDANGNQAQTSVYYNVGNVAHATVTSTRTDGSNVAILDSSDVKAYILANAGAVNGSGRDAIDTRIANEVANGTGKIIDKVSQVYDVTKTAAQVAAAADSDRDGMSDWFEDLYGLDKRKADDKGDNDGDGYTNVEEYINGLITGFNLGPANLAKQATGDFKIKATALTTVAEVIGFPAGSNVPIDLSAVIRQFDASKQSLSHFVEIAYANGNSYISVDSDGPAGSVVKTLVAVIDNAHVTMADLIVQSGLMGKADLSLVVDDGIVAAVTPVYDPHIYLDGSAAADIYTIKSDLERIIEVVNGGADNVVSYVDYTLDANVENLSLKGTAVRATGNTLDNRITGNDADNILSSLEGNDRISGGNGNDTADGGAGDDWLEGGNGNDRLTGGTGADTLLGNAGRDYFCFNSGDTIASATTAQDRIVDFCAEDVILIDGSAVNMAAVTSAKGSKYADAYSTAVKLIAGKEDMVVVHGAKDSWLFWDSNGDGAIDGGVTLTGAALTKAAWVVPPADLPVWKGAPLTPAAAAAAAAAVQDPYTYLRGTAADNVHTVKSSMDRVVEAANAGTDSVVASVNYTLDANVENLSLKGLVVQGTGNALDNRITGNDTDNILTGLAGNDRIVSGNGNDKLYGGMGDDWLEGGNGNDIIWGGVGADVLVGNVGRDYFCFGNGDSLATKASAQDRIVDFCAEDVIVINGQAVNMAGLSTAQASKYADAYTAADKIIVGAADMAVIHGAKDSWLFWDSNGDGAIDGGVTLTGAALTKAAWVAPPADLPLL